MTAPPEMAELRLAGPGLTVRLSGPAPLVQAVALTLTRLLASPRQRVKLYLILLRHSDAAGHCRLYQEQLAALTGLSTRHLRRRLTELANAGLIHIHHQPRPQPNGYYLPLRAAWEESAGPAPPDTALSAKEEEADHSVESAMIHEHDADSLPDKVNRHLLFLHAGQRQARLAQPHCTPAYLQAWDEWWAAGRFGRLRNPAGWANLQIKAGHPPPVAPTPLPLLVMPVEAIPTEPPTAEDVLWAEILAQLRLQMTRATFETWLTGTRLAGREGHIFTLAVPSAFARDWLEHRLQPVIKRAIAQITDIPPDQLELVFRVGD